MSWGRADARRPPYTRRIHCCTRRVVRRGGFDGEDRRRPEGLARIRQGKRLPDLRPGQRPSPGRRRQPREDRSDPDSPRRTGHRADRGVGGRGARGRRPGRARRRSPRRTRPQFHGRGRQPPHRRPGADVPHPDGLDPAAQARAGNRPGQEDRSHPQALPPQGAGMRRRPAAGGRAAQARPRRRPAVRPHRQGVADGEPGEGQDPPADAAQPEDARTPDGAEPGGLRQGPRPAHAGGRPPPAAPPAPHPPPQGRDAGRGAVDPHAEGPAADEEAGADLGADGRAGSPDHGAAGRGRL